jgi:hypothetical protein
MNNDNKLTIKEAIESLYDIAIIQGKSTSTIRLQRLAEYCVQELARRDLSEVETEVVISGGGREKNWDVAWDLHGKYRLAISLKSILKNLAGTVPNRIDDLIGEVANVQMYSPEIVVGYIMVFDVSQDCYSKKHGTTWCDYFQQRLEDISGRKPPSWSIGMTEAFAIIKVDFSSGPKVLTQEDEIQRLFDLLAKEVKRRNPSLLEGNE